ncbi:heme exporter protein CcmD [Halomonas caseinilytica]|uniref:Heme exporter protein D n=1 Tax=Halomonas caseinilytica TaxID=438744 RepID=A0A1M6R3W8_9GAMM|nr:heme exporter protein CcmD [Halomonas caseinilytica]SEM03579.1 heme exporter protein D [Halomonas caseinilytica]SHK27028.1 heme exporter protein D [Halomonas caseinilytica]
MAFDSLAAFLSMGGYAPYVWPAYGATLLLLLGVVCHLSLERRRLWRELRRRARRERHQSRDGGTTP